MTTSAPSPVEDVELTLMQRDVDDLVRALVGHRGHPDSGNLVFPTMPLVGLVAEETFGYLSRSTQAAVFFNATPRLFERFPKSVTKTRARIKLFDDTDGEMEGLIDLLALAHARSVDWFRERHPAGLLGAIARRLQPDLGVSFVGEDLVATTHTVLPAIGVTAQELRDGTPLDLESLGVRAHSFSVDVGGYLAALAQGFAVLGKPVNLSPPPLQLDIRVTHNDFSGSKAYELVVNRLRPSEARFAGAIVMVLCHVNSALRLLPRLLHPESALLFRIQFLTAYHARSALALCLPELVSALPTLSQSELGLLSSKKLRNTCAHYGLRSAAQSATGAADPFGAAVAASAGAAKSDVAAVVHRWLEGTSTAMTARLSKASLSPGRALFGSHS